MTNNSFVSGNNICIMQRWVMWNKQYKVIWYHIFYLWSQMLLFAFSCCCGLCPSWSQLVPSCFSQTPTVGPTPPGQMSFSSAAVAGSDSQMAGATAEKPLQHRDEPLRWPASTTKGSGCASLTAHFHSLRLSHCQLWPVHYLWHLKEPRNE